MSEPGARIVVPGPNVVEVMTGVGRFVDSRSSRGQLRLSREDSLPWQSP